MKSWWERVAARSPCGTFGATTTNTNYNVPLTGSGLTGELSQQLPLGIDRHQQLWPGAQLQGSRQQARPHAEAEMALELQSFASALQLTLGHLGVVSIDPEGVVPLHVPDVRGSGEARTFTFLESLEEIRSRITIVVITCHSMWPGRSREAASMAAFSLPVQEAIQTAEEWVSPLRLTSSGVVAGP